MNKLVTPKQLELTGEEVLMEALPPRINPESSADLAKVNKIEEEETARAVLGSGAALADEDDFDWSTDDAVVLREQRATAVYHNRLRELTIRRKAAWDDERDTFVYVTPENCNALMDGIAKRVREG